MEVEALLGLIEVAHKAAEVSWRVEGGTTRAELLVASEMKKLQDKMNEWRNHSFKKLIECVPKKGTAKVTRWPTRLQKKMNAAGDDQALREKAEKDERGRWIKELKKQLEDGECPAVASHADAAELTRRFGKGRRANTLRKHVRTWEKLSSWVSATFQHPWPENAGEVAAYLESRADEPCGRSVPSSIFKTLIFMECAGEVPLEQQLNRDPAVKNVLEEVNMQLAEKSGGFTRRAWHIPIAIVVAWEDVVVDRDAKEYVRCYAWYRLVKLWTGMRFSDTCGMLEDTGAPHVWSHGGLGQDQDHWTGEEGPAFEDLGQRFMLAQERRMVENGLRALEGNGQGGRFGRERFCLTLPIEAPEELCQEDGNLLGCQQVLAGSLQRPALCLRWGGGPIVSCEHGLAVDRTQ